MKELYISPELELILLTAKERLANEVEDEFDFDTLLGEKKNSNAVNPSDSDIDVPLVNLGL